MTPEQQEIIDIITKIWEQNPSLRFLQLIGNCTGPIATRDIYFISDDTLKGALEHTYSDYVSGLDPAAESSDLEHDGKREDRLWEQDFEDEQSRLRGD